MRRRNERRTVRGVLPALLAALAAGACAALAGCAEPDDGPFEVRLDVMGMDGNIVRSAVFPARADQFPTLAVSPDGQSVVAGFAPDARFLDGNLLLRKYLRADRTGYSLLMPGFSPDGRQVAFISSRSGDSASSASQRGGVSFFDSRGNKAGSVSTGSLFVPEDGWPRMESATPWLVKAVSEPPKEK